MGPMLSSREEQELSSRYNKKTLLFNLIVLLIIFIVVTFILPNGSQKNLFTWDDFDLLIACPDGTGYTIPYSSMTHIVLIEDADMGTCLSGENGANYRYGRWKNDVLGEYILCAYKSFSTVIQLTTAEEIYWISYESPETTKGLYESVVETLQQEGYTFETAAP